MKPILTLLAGALFGHALKWGVIGAAAYTGWAIARAVVG